MRFKGIAVLAGKQIDELRVLASNLARYDASPSYPLFSYFLAFILCVFFLPVQSFNDLCVIMCYPQMYRYVC